MNKNTMGTFMAALRKARGLTQQEVADALHVSNKTVSKWECDDGFPEIMMLPVIAELYGVTVDELLKGERLTREQGSDIAAPQRMKYMLDKTKLRLKNVFLVCAALHLFALVCLLFLPLIISDYRNTAKAVAIGITVCITLIVAVVFAVLLSNALANMRSGAFSADETELGSALRSFYRESAALLYMTLLNILTAVLAGISTKLFTYSFLTVFLPVELVCALILFFPFSGLLKNHIEKSFVYIKTGKDKTEAKRRRVAFCVISGVMAVFAAVPFAQAQINLMSGERYTFDTTEGYERCKTLYNQDEGYIISWFEDLGDGREYHSVWFRDLKDNTEVNKRFNTQKEYDEFCETYVLTGDYWNLPVLAGDCRFNDSKETVTYYPLHDLGDAAVLALDVLPVWLLIGAGTDLLTAAVGYAVYRRKKV